jgi:hypothetical protein
MESIAAWTFPFWAVRVARGRRASTASVKSASFFLLGINGGMGGTFRLLLAFMLD